MSIYRAKGLNPVRLNYEYCDVAHPYLCCQADECHESSSSSNLKHKRNYCQALKQARPINHSYKTKELIGPATQKVLRGLFWNCVPHNSDCYGRRKCATGTHVRVGAWNQKVCRFQHPSSFGRAGGKRVVRTANVTFLCLGRSSQLWISINFQFKISNRAPRSAHKLWPSTLFSGHLLTYLLTPWSRVLLEKLTSKLCS